MDILKSARKTLQIEGESLLSLIDQLNDDFKDAVESILKSKGRLVITGVGKSANIAHKMVATFNSTGQPALFMHAADALHGDLGNVLKDDVVLCISNSGNTEEIKALIPLIRTMGNTLIGMTGNTESFLAKESNYVINSHVAKEACPNNLAPTSSTTAQLALGDALAVCLLEKRNFSEEDFAKYHPGGSLGKRLYLTAGELAAKHERPQVDINDSLSTAVIEISKKRLGACVVLDQSKIAGIITDGDIRRALEKNANLSDFKASEVMSKSPKSVEASDLASHALGIMEKHNITQLVVLDKGSFAGIIHLHDILKEGIF